MSRSLSPPANTLIEGPASGDDATPEVYDVLSRPDETNLLVLSYDDGPDAWLQNWRTTVGDLPSEVGFVHVGVKTRSAAAAHADALGSAPAGTTPAGTTSDPITADGLLLADAVSDPTDLARLGVTASEYLEVWDGNGRETVVYLDSLTDLLENVDLDHAFRFLHVLGSRIESVDASGYYLIDPAAHDDHSLAVVRELVDSVIDLDS